MKKVGMARSLWKSLPQWTKRLLKFLWNLFPLEIEKLDDFIAKVKESEEPVEVEKIIEPIIITSEYNVHTVLGRRFVVKLRSFASNGKEIVHKAFNAFLSADLYGQIDEKENEILTQKVSSEAQKIFKALSLKNIPIKSNVS